MVLSSGSKFPSRLTYVVKLSSDSSPDALTGRLENLVTGKRENFASAHELLSLIVGDILERDSCDGP
jgi:hypothetical protein